MVMVVLLVVVVVPSRSSLLASQPALVGRRGSAALRFQNRGIRHTRGLLGASGTMGRPGAPGRGLAARHPRSLLRDLRRMFGQPVVVFVALGLDCGMPIAGKADGTCQHDQDHQSSDKPDRLYPFHRRLLPLQPEAFVGDAPWRDAEFA